MLAHLSQDLPATVQPYALPVVDKLSVCYSVLQVYMCCNMISKVQESVLEKAYQRAKDINPGSSDGDIFRELLKTIVPASLPGSPAFHRGELQKLLSMCDNKGRPQFLLTLTADELSSCRWQCADDLEEFYGKCFMDGGTWHDIPIECAALFHARLTNFLKEHIFVEENGLLGKVKHWLIRYEVQGRGSLHAHILLWMESEAEADRVASEITASMPCVYREEVGPGGVPVLRPVIPDPEDDSMVSRLCRMVMTKQRHTCSAAKPYGCAAKGHARCEKFFPFPACKEGTIFNPDTNRFEYFRMCEWDQNIVPYHPAVLLLWNGHMNLQRITDSAWSFYVLKYTTKCEPTGHLSLDPEVTAALGLQDLSPHQAQLAAAGVLSKPLSVAEAFLILAKIPIISSSVDVTYIDTKPPEQRTCRLYNGYITTPPVDTYCVRPEECLDLKFKEYFEAYEVRPPKNKAVPKGAESKEFMVDNLGNRVYKLKESRVIRTSDPHPASQSGAFFYEMLLNHRPFTDEAEILPKDGNYFAGKRVPRSYSLEGGMLLGR